MRPSICVSVKARRTIELRWKAERALEMGADLVELRLDFLENPLSREVEVEELISQLGAQAVVTLRPRWEGGEFGGAEEERLEALERLSSLGPAYVDLELKAARKSNGIRGVKGRIVSWHSFSSTPEYRVLSLNASKALTLGEIGKVVAKASSLGESLRILRLYRDYPAERLVAFGIGAEAAVSRILSIFLGAPIIYACLPGEEVAAGQPTVGEVLELFEVIRVGDKRGD